MITSRGPGFTELTVINMSLFLRDANLQHLQRILVNSDVSAVRWKMALFQEGKSRSGATLGAVVGGL
jgi:hypothetical protein